MIKNIKIGDKIGSNFLVLDIYGGEGKSGFGTVYMCLELEYNYIIALKTFQDKYIDSEEVENFKHEALAWIKLEKHPNIITAVVFDIIDSRPFIIMELVLPDKKNRKTLEDYLKNNIKEPQILDWGIQFCYGMDYAASKEVSPHRDVKPSNLIITGDKLLKITDFGLAKIWDGKNITISDRNQSKKIKYELSFLKRTSELIIVGTGPYMAPEVFSGNEDLRSDIYSFGIVLFQMLNKGKLPYVPKAYEDWGQVHITSKIPSIHSKIFPIVKKCLEKNPNNRYQDFNELRDDLEQLYIDETNEEPYSPEQVELKAEERSNKGYALEKLGLLNEAIIEHEKATNEDPESFLIRMNLGRTLMNVGKSGKAIPELKKAIDIDPKSARAHYNLGNAYFNVSEYKKAANEYKKAINLKKNYKEVYTNFGNLLRETGKINESLEYYEKALTIDENFFLAKLNQGIAFAYKKNYNEAIKCFKCAEEIKEDHPRLYYIWGLVLSLKGNDQEALHKYFKALIFDADNSEIHNNIGISFAKLGKSDNAFYEYKKALKLNPKNVNAHHRLGVAFSHVGEYKEALKCYNKAIEIEPNYAIAWNDKGKILGDLGEYEEALKCYNKAIEIEPNYAMAWLNKGSSLCNLKKVKEGLNCFNKAVEIEPDFPEAWLHKGRAMGTLAKNQNERYEAIKALNKALEMKPGYDRALLEKGMLLGAMEKFKESHKYLNKALETNPDLFEGWLFKRAMLEFQGKGNMIEANKCEDEMHRINPHFLNKNDNGC